MRKLSIELPKYRLQLHYRLVKRRKPLLAEPILPNTGAINKKYRKGSLVGKFVRHISGHKSVRKILTANFAALVVATSFIPATKASNSTSQADEIIVQAAEVLDTQKTSRNPLDHIKINQGYAFYHPGLDLGAKIGEAVYPMKSGIIQFAGYTKDGYGNQVVVDHGNGLTTRYAHLSKIFVHIGQSINTELEIGTVGITGHTSGPHLHFEVRQNDRPLNPLNYITK